MSKLPAFTPIEKRCLVRGCTAYPLRGFGRPGGAMQWACGAHKNKLNSLPGTVLPPLGETRNAPATAIAGAKAGSAVVEQPQTPATPRLRAPQGRLL